MEAMSRQEFITALRDREFRYQWMDRTIRESLQAQIRGMRESRGWTQKQLARQLGTTQPSVARMESDSKWNPHIRSLIKIARVFDVALIVRFESWSSVLAIYAEGVALIPSPGEEVLALMEWAAEEPQ